MRGAKRYLVAVITLVLMCCVYETGFRLCASKWGEVCITTTPVSVYYTADLWLPGHPLATCFKFRARLPYGSIKLNDGSGAWLHNGKVCRRSGSGEWDSIDEMLSARRNKASRVNSPYTAIENVVTNDMIQ